MTVTCRQPEWASANWYRRCLNGAPAISTSSASATVKSEMPCRPGGVLLGKVDLSLGTELGTPQAHAPLQGAQHAGVPLVWVAALEFFEQGDGVEMYVGLKQRHDLAVPNRIQRILSGAPVSFGALGGQAWGLLDAPGAALADASFGSGGHLAELVAVLLVLVHLVVRDSLAGHAAYLRFVSKAQR